MNFNEHAMVSALLCRDQDARDIHKVFKPEWLQVIDLQPVLRALYDYMNEHEMVPSLASLSQFMEAKDKAKFDARWKGTLSTLQGFESKAQALNVKLAKQTAASRAFQCLIQENRIQTMIESGDANALRGEVSRWISAHTESEDEGLYTLQQGFDKAVDEHDWQGRAPKIATGIRPIDEWSGGLRPPQMGIIMAPSGHGKSALLMNFARYAACVEEQIVLFITNEMTVTEQMERFMVRMQDPKPGPDGQPTFVTLNQIQDNPAAAYKKLEGYQEALSKRLFIYSAGLNQDAMGVEDVMRRVKAEHGVWPSLVVIDYLERMATCVRMDKARTWTYLGQIAKELVWLQKRRNCSLWTAIQTNRGGMSSKVTLGMEHAQGSIEQLQESALAYAVRRVMVTSAGGEQVVGLEFTEMKSRHGAMEGRQMILRADLSRMYVSNEVIENVQEIEDVDPADVASGPAPAIKGPVRGRGKP